MSHCLSFGVLFVALAAAQFPARAQFADGSISGTVTDKSGAIVPGAKVILKDEKTNAARDSKANGSGFFSFASVQPATYTIIVTSDGLETFEETGIIVNQGSSLTIPKIILQVAATKQQIEVVMAADVFVPTDSGQSSQTLNQGMVENLSIVGRDAAELIKIMPGMGMATGLGQNMWNSYTTGSNSGPIGAFSANGTQPNGGMTMTSDGANLLDPGNQGTQTANVNQNQVQEVSILNSAYDASFAKGPVTFQAIGKSGGAQFHGQGYLYARNGVFNSIDSFTKADSAPGTAKPVLDSYYYPGGDFGGPVILPKIPFNRHHDKLFFYTAYEYMKQQPQGSLQNYFLPTSEMEGGNFSPSYIASLGPGFASSHSNAAVVPCLSGGNGCSGLAINNGMVPQSLINASSLAYAKTFPTPNVDPATNPLGANYQYFLSAPQNRWEYRIRGDYNISDNTKVFVSWNHQNESDLSPISVWWWIGGQSLPYPSSQAATQISNVYSANLVHVFSPTVTNEFIFSAADFNNPIILGNAGAVNPSKVGFSYTGLYQDTLTPQIPNVFGWNNALAGYLAPTYGEAWPAGGGGNAFGKISRTPNVSDNTTVVWGKHTFKAGVYWDYARNNQTTGGYNAAQQGSAEFENWGATSTGNPLTDFLIAHETQYTQPAQTVAADFKYYQYSFFINDQWKATRSFTVTAGLRFDHMGNWFPSNGIGLAVWDPSTYVNSSSAGAYSGLEWNKIDPNIPISGFPSRTFFYEPRIGLAYDLFGNGKTVLRGGAGLYRYQLAYNSVSGDAYNDPQGIPTLTTTWGCCVGWNNFSQYSPSQGTPGSGSSPNGILQMGDSRTPYTWTYNFTISQRAPWRSVAEFQYSGNASRDTLLHGSLSSIDEIPLGAFFKADPITGVVNNPTASNFPTADYYPLHFYDGLTLISHGGYSNYNAFITTWQKQSGRVTFTTNYTFSKVLGIRDNVSDNGQSAGNTLDPYSLGQNYGVLGWDHTHIFNAAYVINLPSPMHGNKIVSGAVNGWILSGITQLQSGAPIQPNTSGTLNATFPGTFSNTDILGTNSESIIPALVCDPRKGLSSGQYFNTACFAPPSGAQGVNGNYIWPFIHGPAFFNSDLAVYKTFMVREKQKLEFRFSAFNFLNHPLEQFGLGQDINLNFITNGTGTLAQTNQNAQTTGKPEFTTGRRVVEFTLKYMF